MRSQSGNPLFLLVLLCLFAAHSCSVFQSAASADCVLVELKKNPERAYYDAVIRLESVDIENAFKARFQVLTPTNLFECSELSFVEDGQDTDLLEPGDTFIVPLVRPEWGISLREDGTQLCQVYFWDSLPVSDQFHPTKTEAMAIVLIFLNRGVSTMVIGIILPNRFSTPRNSGLISPNKMR